MLAPRSPKTTAKSRRVLGAALGLTLLAGAAPFLRPANAVQPTGDAIAALETAVTSGADAIDPAIWLNPSDGAQSLVLGANGSKFVTYDMAGAVVAQPNIPDGSAATDFVATDVRPNVSVGTMAIGDMAVVAGEKSIRFYAIDPASRQMTNRTLVEAGINPEGKWRPRSVGEACLYTSPVSSKTYLFILASNGHLSQLELIENSGKIDLQQVRGGTSDATAWDVVGTGSTASGCVVDDEMKTLYISETSGGIMKIGAEPTDPTTSTMIDTVSGAATPGNLLKHAKGMAIVETGVGTTAGYLIVSTINNASDTPVADGFAAYDRVTGAYLGRTFQVLAGAAADRCELTDGMDAAAGNFGSGFTSGLLVCQDKTNRNGVSGSGTVENNYKFVALDSGVDMTPVTTTTTTLAPPSTTTTTSPVQIPNNVDNKSGYWMVGSDGKVYAFGDAKTYGDAALPAGAQAVDIEPTPSGLGYWILSDFGQVTVKGDAKHYGDVSRSLLTSTEVVTSLSATKTGNGYWAFTSAGRAIPFGDAVWYGDMRDTKLNGPVLDSISTPSGKGYYMVGSDGGIFSFGDAKFYGSMGDKKLNAPVQSLVPDSDGVGYWLVASDGGIFAFDAGFRGSMGDKKLNKPVTGMVRYGNGYLMVGEDGGIFSFSDKLFAGSLGATPPARPITSVAVLDVPKA